MNRKTIGTIGATFALACLAPLAIPSPAAAWDDLPCGATEAEAHTCAPGEADRFGNTPVPLPPPAPVAVAPLVIPPAPLAPLVAVPTGPPKTTPPQPPHPNLTCKWLHHEGAGVFWLVQFNCSIPPRLRHHPRHVAVAGEYRRAQSPGPASIVNSLARTVLANAQDIAGPASSIRQGAGGLSASVSTDAAERGRLVPLGIPGHPWSAMTKNPHRSVAVSVSWASGPMRVSVVYSASRGRSTTSVTARITAR